MSGNLVNAFGKITLEETQAENRDLLLHILEQLRIMNIQLALLTDNEVTKYDLDPHEET